MRLMPFAPFEEKITRLLQYFPRVLIFFADDVCRIAVQEPPVAAVLARLDANIGFVRFCKEKDDGIIYALTAHAEIKPFISPEVRLDVQFRFLDAGLLFKLAQRRVDTPLARLEVPLREIPIIPAPVQKQKLYPIGRFPVDHKACHHLFFGRRLFAMDRIFVVVGRNHYFAADERIGNLDN
jgi:hypothetical protein